jgi:hypothetical protein
MTKRTRKNIPKGFDSWLEFDLSKELRQCKFHTEKIPYVQRKTYEPDFIFYDEEEELLTYIEVKGRFRDRAEAKKYVDIRGFSSSGLLILSVLMNLYSYSRIRELLCLLQEKEQTALSLRWRSGQIRMVSLTTPHRVYQTSGDLKDDNTKTE